MAASNYAGKSNLVTLASGLLVPESAQSKKSRVLPADKFKKMTRLMRDAAAEGIATAFVCPGCKRPVALRQDDRIAVVDLAGNNARGGNFVLECECTEWVVR